MGMLYPPSFLSHHISLQLMLQREFHVITLALLSCPHERGREERETGEQRREQREEAEAGKKRRERETIKTGLGCHDGPVLCRHVNVACQLNGAERGRCDWRLVECMLSLSIIVAKRNQTDASRMEDALTAVITHRHGDHFWPAVDGRRRPLLQSAFNQIGLSVVR